LNISYLVLAFAVFLLSYSNIKNTYGDPMIVFVSSVFIMMVSFLYLWSFRIRLLESIKKKSYIYFPVGILCLSLFITSVFYDINYLIPVRSEYRAHKLYYARVYEEYLVDQEKVNKTYRIYKIAFKGINGLGDESIVDSSLCWNNDSVLVKETIGVFGLRTSRREFRLWKTPAIRDRELWRSLRSGGAEIPGI
jgi:hypothetical protein